MHTNSLAKMASSLNRSAVRLFCVVAGLSWIGGPWVGRADAYSPSELISGASLQEGGSSCFVDYDSAYLKPLVSQCSGDIFATGSASGSPAVLAEESSNSSTDPYEAHEFSIASPDGTLSARYDTNAPSQFSGTASPSASDTLHVTVAGANASTLTTLRFETGLEADLSGPPSGNGTAMNFVEYGLEVTGGVDDESVLYQLFTSATGLKTHVGGTELGNFQTFQDAVGGGGGGFLDVTVQGPTADLFVVSDLECASGIGGQCNATVGSGSGYVFGVVPRAGVRIDSASGLFPILNSGVPEPASWALMLVGVGGLGAALRRRRPLAPA